MSSADKKVDVSGRRTMSPGRSHGGPVSMVVPAGSPKSYPPPPPLAALRTRTIKEEEQPLAFVPQWEDIPDPMRPAPKRLGAFFFKLGTGTLAACAFAAAGYFGALWHSSQNTPRLSPLVAAESARPAPKVEAPVLTSTAPAALRDTPLDAPLAAPAPTSIAASADGAKVEKAVEPKTKRAAAAKPSLNTATKIARAKRVKLAEPPAPAEAEAEESSDENESASESKLARATKKEPAVVLPEQPSRNDVQAGIEGVRPALNVCAAGAHGTVFANLTIMGNGRVSYSVVEGEFTNGAVGSCMARALRGASFPQFSGPSLKVRYPFVF